MSELNIIYGESGSGKSEIIYKMIKEEASKNREDRYFLIVPDQITGYAERRVTLQSEGKTTFNVEAIGLSRLAYRVFEELNVNVNAVLEDEGKSMLVRKVMSEVKDSLSVYKNMGSKPGFIDQMKSVISEFYQYEIDDEKIEALLDETKNNQLLNLKLRDIKIISDGFKKSIGDSFMVAETIPDMLAELVKDSVLVKGAHFYFDGFTGFTPNQYVLIEALMKVASDLTFTVTVDEQEFVTKDGHNPLFNLSHDTIEDLTECFSKSGEGKANYIKASESGIARHSKNNALEHLSKNVFRFDYDIKDVQADDDSVVLAELNSTRDEVKYVAHEIYELVSKSGYRYRDIAVITSSSDEYNDLIANTFGSYDIPYFLDDNVPIVSQAYVESLRTALDIASKGKSGFGVENMLKLISYGVSGIDENETRFIRRYLRETSTTGYKAWKEGFTRTPKSLWGTKRGEAGKLEKAAKKKQVLDHANEIRMKIMEPLDALQAGLTGETTVNGQVTAIYNYMTALKYEENMYIRAEELNNEGDTLKSSVWSKTFSYILGILDKIALIMGGEALDSEELKDIIDVGLAAMSIGRMPSRLDTVIVGDIVRTRINDVKAVFILGLNDDKLPKNSGSPNLITNRDRIFLNDLSVKLAPGAEKKVYEERFYLYLAMSKASERLCMTYARLDKEGTSLRKAYVNREVCKLFNGLEAVNVSDTNYIDKRSNVFPYLSAKLSEKSSSGEANEDAVKLLAVLKDEEKYSDILERFKTAYGFKIAVDAVDVDLVEKLFGKNLRLSISAMESFRDCPYKYLMKNGLRLTQEEEYSFESSDYGSVLHLALELFMESMSENNYDYRGVTELQIEHVANCAIDEAFERLDYDFNENSTTSFLSGVIRSIGLNSIKVICEHLKRGEFKPFAFEYSFGMGGEEKGFSLPLLPDYKVNDDEQLSEKQLKQLLGREVILRGIIDRVDKANVDGKTVFKVIDYKTGSKRVDMTEVYYGRQLQLLTYLSELKKTHQNAKVAGAFYFHIFDPIVKVEADMDVESAESDYDINHEWMKQYKMQGLLSDDLDILNALETHEQGSYEFETVSMKLNKEGDGINSRYKAYSEDMINTLIEMNDYNISKIGREIALGQFDISPMVNGSKTGCDYCDYKDICLVDGNLTDCMRVFKAKNYKNIEEFVEENKLGKSEGEEE